jgi:spore coat protein CotH
MHKKAGLLIIVMCVAFAIVAGCSNSSSKPTQASPNQVAATAQSVTAASITTTAAQTAQYDFSKVTHTDVSAIAAHWSSGAENDGIIIHPDLKDAAGESVQWSGSTLPVDIEIYTTKTDSNYKTVKDQLVYKGTGTISDWMDGNMFSKGGIQVSFASMQVPAGETFGITYVTVHTPDGKTYAAKYGITPLTP